RTPGMVREGRGRPTQLRTRRRSRLTSVLLRSRRAGNLFTRTHGPPSPRIPRRQQSGRSGSAQVGPCTRGRHPRRAPGVPPVRGTLLCDLLARSPRIQAGGGLSHPRSDPVGGSAVAAGSRTFLITRTGKSPVTGRAASPTPVTFAEQDAS